MALEMMDRNPMLQNLNNPVANLGVIPGKVQLDWAFIQECMANADDQHLRAVYPGGNKDQNHDAMPGDMSFGLKCVRNAEVMQGEPNELGIVSVAGINTELYSCQRAMEDQFYFQGFVATECRVSDPMGNSATQDPDHGYATIRVGTVSTNNNGPYMVYPGQLLAWRFPASPLTSFMTREEVETPFGNQVNLLARGGTPSSQFRPEIVPFDPFEFSLYYDAAYAAMTEAKTNDTPGIRDIPFADFFKDDGISEARTMSGQQEEAGGHKYSKIGIVLAGLEVLVREGFVTITTGADAAARKTVVDVATAAAAAAGNTHERAIHERIQALSEEIGLWKPTAASAVVLKMFANMFFMDMQGAEGKAAKAAFERNIDGADAMKRMAKKQNFDDNTATNYAQLRIFLSEFDSGRLIGNWHSKTSKIVGRAMNAAAPGDTLHVLAGHFSL